MCACGCGQPTKWLNTSQRWQKYVSGHYHPKKLYHNVEWLKQEYIEKGRSVQDIAAQFGVYSTAVFDVMRKHGIERRSNGETLALTGATRGAKNPAWKGGVAAWDYAHNWKSLCKSIKDRDKWTCQLCGEQRKRWGHQMHVHHIDEDKTNNHPHNLISLCAKCHAPVHGKDELRQKLMAIAVKNTDG
jgi:hypothetical protein